MRFIAKLIRNVFRKPSTEAFPFGPADTPTSYRGRITVKESDCVGCSTCAQVCVSDAIRLDEEEDGIRLTVWHSKCTFCGLCEFYCPTDAIVQTNDWDLGHLNGKKYAMAESIVAKYQICVDCGCKLMVPNAHVMAASLIGQQRHNQTEGPVCETCRRQNNARRVTEVKL